jgi:thiosulfate/3-mercaptopyruvate sulfurtransferase
MDPEFAAGVKNEWGAISGHVPPMESSKKVLIDAEKFFKTVHGQQPCSDCHGGTQAPEKADAHKGMVRNPTDDPDGICGKCHPDIIANKGVSLHVNLTGFWTVLSQRSSPDKHPVLQDAMSQTCNNCHTTCGECHVSQPVQVGGGFVDGHVFSRRPSMIQNCAGCHGVRAGSEYMGNNQEAKPDVHFSQAKMECVDCHVGKDMHGQPADCHSCHKGPVNSQVQPADHRYSGVQAPRCETCHANVSAGQDDVIFHKMHGANLSCQVCHTVSYSSCDGCHLTTDQKTGQPSFELDSMYSTFLIGLNPVQTYERPYRYVPVRHVPVTPNTFDLFGKGLLPNFDQLNTWKYATPHNIQLRTPQTESCNACHGNPVLFLTADKVAPSELAANKGVIVNQVPPMISSSDQLP